MILAFHRKNRNYAIATDEGRIEHENSNAFPCIKPVGLGEDDLIDMTQWYNLMIAGFRGRFVFEFTE